MNKYKIVGIINIFIGISIFLVAFSFVLIVIPKLSVLYTEFGADTPVNISDSYSSIFILFTIAIVNIFFGIKGISNTQNKETYFKYGLITAILTFLLSGIVVRFMIDSAIDPIYNLNSHL